MDITLQEAEACIQELPARSLHQLPQDLQRDRGRPIPHVSWEAEINEPAGAPTALVLSAQFWRMQSRKQWPPHTNSHYVIPQCDGLTCFQNGQIRGLQTYTCSRKPSAPILGSDPPLDFSKISRPTPICRRCQGHFATYLPSSWPTLTASKSREQWDTHGEISVWEVLTWRNHKSYLFSNLEVLDRVCLFLHLSPPSRSLIWGGIRLLLLKEFCMFYCFVYPPPYYHLSRLTLGEPLAWGN